MCGLTGFWSMEKRPVHELEGRARRMAETIRHRGPDDSGTWTDQKAGFALGHRRLSILDLSEEGRQPMVSHDGRYVIAYNGEVYNFKELRKELEKQGHLFQGNSDTEVVVNSLAEWGVEDALKKFNGMFALALWDKREKKLVLARDRLGIKPLYWGDSRGDLLFGSELKCFRAWPGFNNALNRNALALFFRHGFIPDPYSVFLGVNKLEPGTFLCFPSPGKHFKTRYWSTRETALRGLSCPLNISEEDSVEELERILGDSITMRMVADVPIGAFLSGGIDSSTVVALMQSKSTRPVKTFSIGFHEKGFNEAEEAKRVSATLGTDHTELYLLPEEVLRIIPSIPEYWDEPFSDPSQIPTYAVSRLARQQVTVSLSGDGGDELFGGYTRYRRTQKIWKFAQRIPAPLRSRLGTLVGFFPPALWDGLLKIISPALSSRSGKGPMGERLSKMADLLSQPDLGPLYYSRLSHFDQPADLLPGSQELKSILNDPRVPGEFQGVTERLMFLDSMHYLPGDILSKVDRASMAVGLEARVPLLDHRVFEYAWKLPLAQRVGGGVGKLVLRRLLERHLPSNLVNRPKMGFGIPLGDWLRGPLRPWAEELLLRESVEDRGLLNSGLVREMWNQHLSGERNRQFILWDVLVFQSWMRHWEDSGGKVSPGRN